jgi:hypothetical protein
MPGQLTLRVQEYGALVDFIERRRKAIEPVVCF